MLEPDKCLDEGMKKGKTPRRGREEGSGRVCVDGGVKR